MNAQLPGLLEAARDQVRVCDGGMGTQLQLAGLEPGSAGELWNVENPGALVAIHRRYLDAGADIATTNTFGGSRLALDRHGLGDRAAELNRAGAALARAAAGDQAWVLGDIGPFGGFLAPLGEFEPVDVHAAFLEQAHALLEGGADGILVETMSDVEEAAVAVRAAIEAGATRHGPRTMMGVAPADAARTLVLAGADVVGVNCGTLELDGYVEVVRAYHAAVPGVPLLVQPNAGRPSLDDDGNAVYHEPPEAFAALVPAFLAAGARIVGGCCGTGPAHIEALAGALARVARPTP
jgi:methionine synthase I (cobalamin-dependent)